MRVQKTRAALTGALGALLHEKDYGDITVTELCERAQVRKATFYKHFGAKDELLAYNIQETFRHTVFTDKLEEAGQNYYATLCSNFMDFLERNQKLSIRIMKDTSGAIMQNIVTRELESEIGRHLKRTQPELSSQPREFYAALFAGAYVNSGHWWLKQKNRPGKEQMIELFLQVVQ